MAIRAAERRDADGIRTIYNHYVNESTTLFDMVPRTLDEQVQWIDEHAGGHPAVVADLDGADRGVRVPELLPLAPRLQHHGRGLRLPARPSTRAEASAGCCSRSCSASPPLTGSTRSSPASPATTTRPSRSHRACGFETVGIEREVGRKFGQWLDVVEMQKML